tara:strand:- start:3474 stop:3821 length:348 start_codon:yes stop_codon:yes gene_type:complete
MDADFIKQVEQFANLKTAINVKKRNAFERANNKLIFAYEGGLFTANPETILFAKQHDTDRDLVLLDNNDSPIKIINTKEFINKAESCYYEAMNEYHSIHEDLKKQRSIKKLMSND